MKQVAWAPTGYSLPIEFLAVRIQPGMVTHSQWWEALSNRVSAMAVKATPEEIKMAFQEMEMFPSPPEDPNEVGQFLVENNENLWSAVNLQSLEGNPFPQEATNQQEAEEVVEMYLLEWVAQAAPMVRG